MKRFDNYINDVESGNQPAGNLIKLAIKRHLKDLNRSDLVFSPEKGYHIVSMIEKHFRFYAKKWAGKPVKLEPWQVFALMLRYGWHWGDGSLRFIKCYEEVARKNGKSIKKGWEALYHLLTGYPEYAVYCGATTEPQARIVVNAAGQTALKSPDLTKHFRLYWYRDKISKVVYKKHHSEIDTLTSQAGKQDGLEPTFGIMDEYHEHPDTSLYDVIQTGMGTSDDPIMDVITTAGFNKYGVCYQLRQVAVEVLENKLVDDDTLILINTIDQANKEGDNWKDEDVWRKANPNLEVALPLKTLRRDFKDAERKQGTTLRSFKTKRLNWWTDSSAAWFASEVWALGDLGPIEINNKSAYCGIQLAATSGFNSICLALNRNDSAVVDVKMFYWLPEDSLNLDRYKDVKDNLLRWKREGWLTLTAGNTIDYGEIIKKIIDLRDQYGCDIKNILFPPQYLGSVTTLLDMGFEGEKCSNTYLNMTEPINKFEQLVSDNLLNHEGNPALRWQMGHVELKQGGDDSKYIDKNASQGSVCGPVSVLMAYKGLIEAKSVPSPGVY